MQARNSNSGLQLQGRIERKTHDIADLRSEYDDWDKKSEAEKLHASRQVEPESVDVTYNVTTDRLHQYFVDNLNEEDATATANLNAAWLALGTDGGSGVATGDTDLNTRTYEETVTDSSDNGKSLLTSTFLDSGEGNGNTFDEIGLWTGDPANKANADVFLINHATFPAVTKDNTKTVTFDVSLQFSDG
jgi:hypothetical protein